MNAGSIRNQRSWASLYGASGDPRFNPGFMPFVMRGGVVAEAHVRGGGEYGEAWHLAGKQGTFLKTLIRPAPISGCQQQAAEGSGIE